MSDSESDADYDPARKRDDDDDDDDDDQPVAKKRRPAGANQFIEEEAEASEEEDEEEDEEEEEGDGGADGDDGDAVDAKAVERENRRLDAERRKAEEAKLEAQVRERYENRPDQGAWDDDEDFGEDTRFQELPDATRDPKLWLLKCKPGGEKMLIISLMQKYLDAAEAGTPLSIKSALCTEIKGYIYVEAFKEAHVREATQGLNGLFYRITQVPPREMTDVMRIRSTDKKALHPGAWVRMRRNDDYKDDLGQVVDIDVDGARARVRLVPRLAAIAVTSVARCRSRAGVSGP